MPRNLAPSTPAVRPQVPKPSIQKKKKPSFEAPERVPGARGGAPSMGIGPSPNKIPSMIGSSVPGMMKAPMPPPMMGGGMMPGAMKVPPMIPAPPMAPPMMEPPMGPPPMLPENGMQMIHGGMPQGPSSGGVPPMGQPGLWNKYNGLNNGAAAPQRNGLFGGAMRGGMFGR